MLSESDDEGDGGLVGAPHKVLCRRWLDEVFTALHEDLQDHAELSAVDAAAASAPRGALSAAAAGISAAFNTPLAGIVFAIEEMRRAYESRAKGLVVFVTGGGSGIGHGICEVFAAHGVNTSIRAIPGTPAGYWALIEPKALIDAVDEHNPRKGSILFGTRSEGGRLRAAIPWCAAAQLPFLLVFARECGALLECVAATSTAATVAFLAPRGAL